MLSCTWYRLIFGYCEHGLGISRNSYTKGIAHSYPMIYAYSPYGYCIVCYEYNSLLKNEPTRGNNPLLLALGCFELHHVTRSQFVAVIRPLLDLLESLSDVLGSVVAAPIGILYGVG